MKVQTYLQFDGRCAEALEFYEGLEADNSKTYWQANRSVYDGCVRAPMEALLADLEAEFGPGKVFRPYRDVRFSRDKSPYKTHAALWFYHRDAGRQVGSQGSRKRRLSERSMYHWR